MPALNLFTDLLLIDPAATPLALAQDTDGIMPPHQRQFWIGSTDASIRFRALSNPGIDQVQLQIVDSASGSGQPASAIKLATTQAGLATAIGGATLDLGVEILSGVANALPVWVQFTDATGVVATDLALKLQTNALEISAL